MCVRPVSFRDHSVTVGRFGSRQDGGLRKTFAIMINIVRSLSTRKGNCKPPWKVLFFGTDRFAVHPLKALIENNR